MCILIIRTLCDTVYRHGWDRCCDGAGCCIERDVDFLIMIASISHLLSDGGKREYVDYTIVTSNFVIKWQKAKLIDKVFSAAVPSQAPCTNF
jgi:hypothetical protein